jgi:hypothetical protein
MHCQKCGFDNLENATMCQQCGGVFVYSRPPRTSGMAVTSMILGISGFSTLGLFGITWILGLIFGMLALSKIGKSGGAVKGKGFAITGIATSASGIALLLTIIGVLLFVNSATTFSLHRKLKMQDGFAQIAQADEKPEIKGRIYIISPSRASGSNDDKTGPDDNCVGILFTPDQPDFGELSRTELVNVTTSLTCGQKDETPVKVSWQFAGRSTRRLSTGEDDEADVYNFTINVPVGENSTSTIKKTIYYDGAEQIIYKDSQRKIYIKP